MAKEYGLAARGVGDVDLMKGVRDVNSKTALGKGCGIIKRPTVKGAQRGK